MYESYLRRIHRAVVSADYVHVYQVCSCHLFITIQRSQRFQDTMKRTLLSALDLTAWAH
jgi:hypothetical protein